MHQSNHRKCNLYIKRERETASLDKKQSSYSLASLGGISLLYYVCNIILDGNTAVSQGTGLACNACF